MNPSEHSMLERLRFVDLSLCLLFNRAVHRPLVHCFFTLVSRLGDGLFWYVLFAAVALWDGAGSKVVLQMAATGAAGLIIYKTLKVRFARERPFMAHAVIQLGARPLDRFSFPSGHTLHAFSLSTIAIYHHPNLALVLVPFTFLVAVSRMVLGLHYPSDVIAGAAMGTTVAVSALILAG